MSDCPSDHDYVMDSDNMTVMGDAQVSDWRDTGLGP